MPRTPTWTREQQCPPVLWSCWTACLPSHYQEEVKHCSQWQILEAHGCNLDLQTRSNIRTNVESMTSSVQPANPYWNDAETDDISVTQSKRSWIRYGANMNCWVATILAHWCLHTTRNVAGAKKNLKKTCHMPNWISRRRVYSFLKQPVSTSNIAQ